jgi:subtilisin family serine protease
LEQPLIDYMARVPAGTPIGVVIVLQRQVSEEEKRILFQNIQATNSAQKMERQRQALTQKLKDVAQESQQPLLSYLRPLETNSVVREIRPVWLSNVIGVKAPAAVIQSLASSNEVYYIHLDLPRRVIHGTAEVPWGIRAIGADNLGTIPINQTVVVAVLDTGVDYTHPDLTNHMWINPGEDLNRNNHTDDDGNGYVDDRIGWNFSGVESNDPADVHGHGTHVAGIIAGDGTGGVRTGIAPQAKIMALRESDASGLSKEPECWLAMQYAVSNHAHIINLSSGWLDYFSPDYRTWRDAGVLFVTVSDDVGDSIWPPFSVSTPGRVPAALTVGWSKPNDSISSKSGKGPVTWTNVSPFFDYPNAPGLIKPDLVAPGEDIKSLKRGGGYTIMSGTSMAAPHVAGVAALLLAQNPNLNPYDVRFILEETAIDVYGPGQPDTGSGWGRLDARAALATNIDTTPYDLSVTNIHADRTPLPHEQAFFFASVTNLGGQVVGNAELQFYFADASNRTADDLDPNRDGKADDARFTYMGSYFVPIVGPKGSKHDSFEGVVRWTIPGPRQYHWWIGVWVLPGAKSVPEANHLNNGAVVKLL